ncbi:MAG: TetR/AcrR family transcriptional regulator [Spirochaetales bacterium]|nr:TetR/AcrR family transcriptional regulator [Spirochaetales bacterium]
MEKEKSDIKAKILETSERLFARGGFEGVAIDEIAKEADVNKSIIYYYFTNKEDLLVHIIRKHLEEFETVFRNMRIGQAGTVRETLRDIIGQAVDYMSRHVDIIKILLRETLMATPKATIDLVQFIDPLWNLTEADLKAAFPRAGKVAPLDRQIFINLIINFILVLGWFDYKKEADVTRLKNAYIERVTDIAEMLILPPAPRKTEGQR